MSLETGFCSDTAPESSREGREVDRPSGLTQGSDDTLSVEGVSAMQGGEDNSDPEVSNLSPNPTGTSESSINPVPSVSSKTPGRTGLTPTGISAMRGE